MALAVLVVVICSGISACTYTGPLRPGFYEPAPPPDQRLPLTLALRPSDEQTFTYVPHAPNFHEFKAAIVLQPGLAQAAQEEFSRVFEQVRAARPSAQAPDPDLIGAVDFYTEEVTRLGNLILDVHLDVVLKDPISGDVVSEYQKKRRVTIPDPPEALTAYFVTAATFFLFAPATIPWTTNAIGRYATDFVQKEIQGLLHAVSRDMREDASLRAYADRRS